MIDVLCLGLKVYLLVMFAAGLASWVPAEDGTTWFRVKRGLNRAVDPVLVPVRSILPPVGGGSISIDVSFILVFFVLYFIVKEYCAGHGWIY